MRVRRVPDVRFLLDHLLGTGVAGIELYLAAQDDAPVPLDGVCELFGRAPAPERMFVLRRADHQHFVDDVEAEHEALRAMSLPGEAAWIPAAMRPVAELCSAEQAHVFTRGLALARLTPPCGGTTSRPGIHPGCPARGCMPWRGAAAGVATRPGGLAA